MKRSLILSTLILSAVAARAQAPSNDSTSFFLHKFAQNIGRETYRVSKTDEGYTYDINFKFVDRGSPVPLKATLKVSAKAEPLELTIAGNTSRMSTIKDKITITKGDASIKVDDSTFTKKVLPPAFTVAGYSPGTVQQVLIQYWKKHGSPANITTLPNGAVQIRKDGMDTLDFQGKPLLLNRYTIAGLIWGNELVWTDANDNLICLITNDAEGDKLEEMKEQYESLLPTLIARAAAYSMRLFAAQMDKLGVTSPKIIAVKGGTVVDVINKTSIPNATVLIEDGKIKEVGTAASVNIPAGAKVIDATGKTVLPGLWDMHSHFEQAEWGPAYLAAGVTTVRDCGNEFEYINAIKNAIDKGVGVGPDILKAGIIDGKGPRALGVIQAATPEEAIAAVDRYKANGFVQIKIYSSVKFLIVKVICDEAHKQGLTVTGHIPQGMNLIAGVNQGMDMVNHMQYVYQVMKINKDHSVDFDDTTTVKMIQYIKRHNMVVDPTIGVYEMMMRSVKDDITVMEPNFYNLPLPLQALFKNTGMEPAEAEKYKPMLQSMKTLVKKLYDEGVPIVAGTDMGFPGYSVDRELELYVEAGLTPAEAIQTATIIPARVMKIDDSAGSLTTGKAADVIIVDGDPLKNIRDIRKVEAVIRGGKIYNPENLHKMVGFGK